MQFFLFVECRCQARDSQRNTDKCRKAITNHAVSICFRRYAILRGFLKAGIHLNVKRDEAKDNSIGISRVIIAIMSL